MEKQKKSATAGAGAPLVNYREHASPMVGEMQGHFKVAFDQVEKVHENLRLESVRIQAHFDAKQEEFQRREADLKKREAELKRDKATVLEQQEKVRQDNIEHELRVERFEGFEADKYDFIRMKEQDLNAETQQLEAEKQALGVAQRKAREEQEAEKQRLAKERDQLQVQKAKLEEEKRTYEEKLKLCESRAEMLANREANVSQRSTDHQVLEQQAKARYNAARNKEMEVEARAEELEQAEEEYKAKSKELDEREQELARKSMSALSMKQQLTQDSEDKEKKLRNALVRLEKEKKHYFDKAADFEAMVNFKELEIQELKQSNNSGGAGKAKTPSQWIPMEDCIGDMLKQDNVDPTIKESLDTTLQVTKIMSKGAKVHVKIDSIETFSAQAGYFYDESMDVLPFAEVPGSDKFQAMAALGQEILGQLMVKRGATSTAPTTGASSVYGGN